MKPFSIAKLAGSVTSRFMKLVPVPKARKGILLPSLSVKVGWAISAGRNVGKLGEPGFVVGPCTFDPGGTDGPFGHLRSQRAVTQAPKTEWKLSFERGIFNFRCERYDEVPAYLNEV